MISPRRKVALQFLVSNLALSTNFLLAIVLARLLSPDDIGIFSMSAVLMTVAHVFRDFGVTTYIMREKDLTVRSLRNAFGVLLATSWTMATIMFVSASYWADFFHDERVTPVVHVLALGFVFIPFGAIPLAIMNREMAVEKTACVTAVSTLVYFTASVGLALQGFGPMSMAWANLINIIATGATARFMLGRPLPWIPSFQKMGGIIHFGLGNLMTALLKATDNALPDVLIGRSMTSADVGLFSRANSTVNMVGTALLPTVNYFALPHMAKVHHSNGKIAVEYLHATSLINALILPALAVIGVLAHEIVFLLYGAAWLGAVPVIPWLCVAYAISSLFTLSAPSLNGIGKPFAAAGPIALTLVSKVTLAIWLVDGTLSTFSMAIALGQLTSIPFILWIHKRFLNVGWRQWVRGTLPLLAQATVVGSACFGVRLLVAPHLQGWGTILVVVTTAAFIFVLSCYVFKLPVTNEFRRIFQVFDNFRLTRLRR